MLVPRSWLAEFCALDQCNPPLTNAKLADAFNELGLIVDGYEAKGEGLDGIVTAQVRTIRAHPNADKIRLVDVVTSADATETLQIACGAWNFNEGDKIPLATLGTTMPDGMFIERRKMRGEWSNGMLCSTRELKLGDDHAGILVLDPATPLGVPISTALGITADVVFDLGIDANRPDAMSIVGIARDLAAKLKVPFTLPNPDAGVMKAARADPRPGSITASDLCDRLTVTIIRNVTVTESPKWIKSRLAHAGMRAINNLVDASNYVMLELGAPSHAFDLDKLAGRVIGVRWAKVGEKIVTLDGSERTLGQTSAGIAVQDGVISDGNDTAVGIAAVMGGATSEVDENTNNLLLEIAHWTPMCIARTSKRMGLRSEASARFERGTDPEGLVRAAERFVEIARFTCPDLTIESFNDIRPVAEVDKKVRVRTARANLLLGTALEDSTIVSLLTPIGFICTPTNDPGVHEVTIPSWRTDATAEVDVIEEIGRHFGYQNIERQTLRTDLVGKLSVYQQQRRRVTHFLADLGVNEVWTPSLMNPVDLTRSLLTAEPVVLSNPLDKAESVLRTSLLPGLLRALSLNANHRNGALRLFEIGHIFERPQPNQIVPYEREHLAVAFAIEGDDARTASSVFDRLAETLRIKTSALRLDIWPDGPGLHPTRTARIIGAGTGFPIGTVGEVDPGVLETWGIDRRVGWLQVDLENLCSLPKRSIEIASFSRFPSSDFDLAFITPEEVPAAKVEAALREGGGDLLESVSLFDVYRGERAPAGTRSLAYRLRVCALDRTLTDAEVGVARQACIDAVAQATGGILRS
jgi:phenylalanyl-tRNA synthetase beta chain